MQPTSKHLENLCAALSSMVVVQDDKLQFGEMSLALRTALNMVFMGTNEAAYAAAFVEQYVPFGVPISDEARQEIVRIINRLEAQSFPVFGRERLSDDLGL